ncbi:MAG: hypothetical protein PHU65_07735 [Actinomycetota bacterium]|nr:hypothetical protein [Actinomycetota bacterium]
MKAKVDQSDIVNISKGTEADFTELKNEVKDYGLGLAICKKLAESNK